LVGLLECLLFVAVLLSQGAGFGLGDSDAFVLLVSERYILDFPEPLRILLLIDILNRYHVDLAVILLPALLILRHILMRGVLVIRLVLRLIVVVLVRFAAGHEPDRHQRVEDHDDQQIHRQHEEGSPFLLRVEAQSAGDHQQDIEQGRPDA